jgi:hypothetical protein
MPLVVARAVGVVGAEQADDVATAAAAPAIAAAAEKQTADDSWKWLAYALVVAGAAVGWALFKWRDPKPFVPGAGISLFAPMYILAQSIERFLEPFTTGLGATKDSDGVTGAKDAKTTKKAAQKARDDALALALGGTEASGAATTTNPAAALRTAAQAQALVDRIRRNKTLIAWGIASAVAMVACGAFGVRLLAAAGFDVPVFWDIAITGLAVGSGTKPLHDLISNIQKSKTAKEDPANVATAD